MKPSTSLFLKATPIILILLAVSFFFFSGYYRAFDYDILRFHYNEMIEYALNYPFKTPLLYVLLYTTAALFFIPGRPFLGILGGFLFEQPFCTFYVAIGFTIGATLHFYAVKSALSSSFRTRAFQKASLMEEGFRKHPVSYLLFLRLTPLFPSWLANFAPALFEVPLATYVWTTFVGTLPAAFLFTEAGRGLNTVLESNSPLSLSAIFSVKIKIALLCIGLLSLLPPIVKQVRKKGQLTHIATEKLDPSGSKEKVEGGVGGSQDS